YLREPPRWPETPVGAISVTYTAELMLHIDRLLPVSKPVDQTGQRHQVRHPERAPAGRGHHERIHAGSVRPPHRQRVLHAVIVQEKRALLGPVPAHTDQ